MTINALSSLQESILSVLIIYCDVIARQRAKGQRGKKIGQRTSDGSLSSHFKGPARKYFLVLFFHRLFSKWQSYHEGFFKEGTVLEPLSYFNLSPGLRWLQGSGPNLDSSEKSMLLFEFFLIEKVVLHETTAYMFNLFHAMIHLSPSFTLAQTTKLSASLHDIK